MLLSAAPADAQAPTSMAMLPDLPATHHARKVLGHDLMRTPARIGAKYFYDQRGCELFEAITRLPEYYPTRTEKALLQARGADIARSVGPCTSLIELGAGNCEKVRLLLSALQPQCFVGVDVAGDFVQAAVERLAREFPGLEVCAVEADITAPVALPARIAAEGRLVFYPGSSIGNFDPDQSMTLLRQMRTLAGAGGGLLIGIDLPKDLQVLEAAYNDAAGVTAEFNRNVLRHVNQCLDSDFDPAQWAHVAFFNAAHSRMEMHLQALQAVQVRWPGGARAFAQGERIHTENSYKYPLPLFLQMLTQAGFKACKAWTDERDWFAVIHARA
ncbi:L-histidine N(alpha)-methyltransferase [Pantoea sp. 18069]|uniref:L-histidine N(alpha)-methyltransferase n=1 Tax=Pantoea sp. 18069 TaxID=2681415 RepID=UPI00135BC651|nr:L-histidine N(alpha)-methyltransferase [Pantoea sp. 18069]